SFTNRSFEIDNVRFEDALRLRVGGFYTPDNTSISSVLKRITYRTGFRYEETGLIVNEQSIDEFGISFGLGIPVSRTYFSNINFGIEIGSRGKTSNGLIQENFINLQFGVSLNDRWFIKRMYN
ncbi:MAG: hypothetical protein RQ756_08950, partial [Flavobacteriaceae bacterium]|nr:hypothetical protein [Flavobacteriaceae bacterium]